jgi:hypothetical protein
MNACYSIDDDKRAHNVAQKPDYCLSQKPKPALASKHLQANY